MQLETKIWSEDVLPRSSGIQLHITSLPSATLGADAYAFVDWLQQAGQRWWQVLPLGPPDRYRSPYKAESAFASWPGLLGEPRAAVSGQEISQLREREAFWIADWERYAGPGAIEDQVRFDREWRALRSYATDRGVHLYGDVPIYIAPDSADHRAHPSLFLNGLQAGAPPDTYSADGQLWGNPLYNWPVLQHTGYRWWVERLRRTLTLFDVARLDHFRGFVSCWEVDGDATTAAHGHWRRGPGKALFAAAERELGSKGSVEAGTSLPLIAEDLGVITPGVERLRDELALPGMLVLQFGFGGDDPNNPHSFANHIENRVVYTGTHDTDTVRGWYESLPAGTRAEVDALLSELGIIEADSWWGLITLALRSPARVAMMQAQDVLGLGSDARMNAPGSSEGNWSWQLPKMPTATSAKKLHELTEAAGRLPGGGASA